MIEDAARHQAHVGADATADSAVLFRLARGVRLAPWPILAITAVAAVFRFTRLQAVAPNEFYDAAVRSMSMSWHNFLFGAFDPGGLLSIDKPPLDLWLQVLSVKLLGWSRFSLKLPEALCGTLAVPLLYDTVRRIAGRYAGIAAAAALAVAPASVLTARSDTMDSVMMLLVIAALWLTVRACQAGARRPIVLAGVALGLAFNVKLLEGMLCLPALVVLYLLGGSVPFKRKLVDLGLGGVALVASALAWAVPVSLWPGPHPWAIGSTDGSVWNAMFVFNGLGRESGTPSIRPGGPGPFRLFVSNGWHYDRLIGSVLVAAIAIGGVAAIVSLWRTRATNEAHRPDGAGRLRRAFAVSLAVWIAAGLVVFDTIATLHWRYLDALAPALAATIGFGAASLAGVTDTRAGGPAPSFLISIVALACVCGYAFHFRLPWLSWASLSLLIATGLVASADGRLLPIPSNWLIGGLVVATALLFPTYESLALVRANKDDSRGLAITSLANARALSGYLMPRTRGVHYELAVDEPLQLAPLIITDRRPILPLTSFGGRRLTGVATLLADVRAHTVRYGLVALYDCDSWNRRWAACSAAARWIRDNGADVTAQAGLRGVSHLYRLTASRAYVR
jgi:4-amino-4-deoxy-L-arabinose transferase-like glycosyltransferase